MGISAIIVHNRQINSSLSLAEDIEEVKKFNHQVNPDSYFTVGKVVNVSSTEIRKICQQLNSKSKFEKLSELIGIQPIAEYITEKNLWGPEIHPLILEKMDSLSEWQKGLLLNSTSNLSK